MEKLLQLSILPNASVFQMLRNQAPPLMVPAIPWNGTSLKKNCCHVYQFPEVATGGVLIKKNIIKKLGKFIQKHLCWSFFLIKLQAWRPVTLFKKIPTQVFYCKVSENFINTNFEEHLRTTAPGRLGQISLLLVLGKPMLDGKRHHWATNTFY